MKEERRLAALLAARYGLSCLRAEHVAADAGSDTWIVTCADGRYVLKYPAAGGINHPELEPALCAFLTARGLPVSRFVPDRDGAYLTADDAGRLFHVQRFVEGHCCALNTAPDWLLTVSAELLGRIHAALRDYPGLPDGIGAAFFAHMTPQTARQSYLRSLETALARGDAEIARDLRYRIGLTERFPGWTFDLSALTCQASHGDYFLGQLICGDGRINAVIDWTSACVHPVVWELMRSYVYAAPECARGALDTRRFAAYVDAYRRYAPLTDADLRNVARLFYYQIVVCDYYGQYYASDARNRDIYLQQAVFSTRLMRGFFDAPAGRALLLG